MRQALLKFPQKNFLFDNFLLSSEMNFSTKFSFKPPLCSQGDGKQKAINPTEAGMSTIH
jgi:hypothetical protein